jgi:hypothetical protein
MPETVNAGTRQEIAASFKPTTGHELLTVQKFRDWAQNEPLPPGEDWRFAELRCGSPI